MPYDPDAVPRRWLWLGYGAEGLSGRSVVRVVRAEPDGDEAALLALGLL